MKKLLSSLITLLAISITSQLSAQIYNMGNLGTVSGACGGTFYDSGGPAGAYTNGQNFTATFCAPAGQYITFTFSSFVTENSFDRLIIYNGPTVGSPLIGNYTGTNSPGTVTSSLGGCITFSFTSDGSITYPGWVAAISCSTTPPPPPPPEPGTCGEAQPFCTSSGLTFPASTGTSAPVGPNYGCLFSQPNPAWYYLNIATSGPIQINLSNSAAVDIDFILWGPFATQASMCAAISAGAVGIDCSYSIAATEQVDIPAAIAGQWYMLLITNYSNVPTNISATAANLPGTDGTTNCAILCNMTGLTAVPGACVPATNQYSVTGQITLSYPPTTGTLTVSSSCGGSTTVPLPWTSPISYTLPGITATGGACSITATFSADPTCSLTTAYTSPAPCNTCAATATNTGPYCAGSTIQLNSTGGGTYSWTGPGGFTSTLQNPSRPTATTAMSGIYTVTVTSGGVICTATTIVTVNPVPVITAEPNIAVCAGAIIAANTFSSTPLGATFTWTNSNAAIGLASSGTTSLPIFTATNTTTAPITSTITVTPTLGTCPGAPITFTITVNPQPTSTFTQSPNQCLTGNTFSFSNTGSTAAGYTYSWNFGGGGATPASSTTNNQSGVVYTTPGTYTITHTITAAGGCTSTTTSTVTIYAMPVVTLSPVTICAGQTATLTAGGATTYTWSAGATSGGGATASATPATTTSYTVTGTNANGCTGTAVATVTVTPLPIITVNSPSICAGATATLSAAGGTTYLWSTGSILNPITVSPAGTTTYNVTGTTGGCSNTAIATVTVNPLPTVTAETNLSFCAGATVPANTFTSAPAGATFTWTNSNAAIGLAASGVTSIPTFTATNATAGPITGTITITPTLTGCEGAPITYTITVNQLPITTVTSATICPGGTATLTAAGAATYSWTAGVTVTGVTTATAAPATTTSYTVTGTSAAGCTSTAIATVTVNPLLAITVNSPTICNGDAATLTAGGGTTYTWSAGATSTGLNTATASATTTTTYTVTGTTAGCSNTAIATVTVNPLPIVTAEPNLTFCAGESVPANTFVSSPAGATFTWTNSNASIGLAASGTISIPLFTAINATASPVTSTITITPTLAGCVGTPISYTLTVNPLPVTTVNSPSICPGGTATLTAAGATTYAWTAGVTVTGLNTATSSPASTTSYTVTGTSLGCTSSAIATVTVASSLTVTVNSPTICDGQVATFTAGGASTYTWSAGASSTGVNTASASPTATTSYTVTGTSAGCSNTAIATVTVNAIPTVTINSPTICAGSTATLTAGGATTYTWSAGATSTGVNTATALPGSTTTYTVTGTTAGCSNTAIATVTVNPVPVVTVNSLTICSGQTANLTATGASTYTWSAGAVSTGTNTANATPGTTTTYTVTGTLSGCTNTAVATVTVTPLPSVTVNSPTICAGQTAALSASGATTYSWSGGASSTGVSTADAVPSTTTTYTVTGTTSGCTNTAVATVTVNPLPAITVNSPTICAGTPANLTASGAATYVWSAGAVSSGVNTANASPATTTSYTVTGTTAGCSVTAVSTVTVNPLPIVSVNSPTVCPGQTATLTAAGAATYTWSAGATSTGVSTASASPGATTSYTVTGTSAGCTGTAVATVTIGGSITVTVNSPTICPGGTATLSASGGTSYVWSAGATSTGINTASASPGSTTSYTVTGTAGGCTGSAVATVTIAAAIAITVNSPTICNGQIANIAASGATAYTWSAGASSTGITTADATPAATTSYTVTGTASGCTGTAVSTVTVTPLPTVTVTSPTICIGSSATLTAGGATTYTWSAGATSTGATTATASPITTTSYTVTGSASGCTNTAVSTVTVTPLPIVTVNSPTICAGQTAALIALGATTYTWSAGAISSGINTANGSPLATTTYTVTGTATGCSNTAVSTITVNPLPVITVNSPTICNGAIATLTATGAATYTWSAGASITGLNTADATPATTTTYTVTGTSAAGCTNTAIATITVTPLPTVTVTSPSICFGAVATITAGGATTYTWTAGATSSGATTATASPATTTTYTVTGTSSGCVNTAVTTVTVNPLPIVTVNSPSICPGSTATLTAGGATTYSWSAGALPTGVNTATASPLVSTTYTVTGTLLGCVATATSTISINAALTVDAGPNDTICFGGSTPLTVTPNGAGFTYSWTPAAGLTSTTIFNPSANPTATTTYVVVVTDINGCSGNDNVTIYSDSQINSTVSGINITCNSACNGSATVSAIGGSNIYTYLWSNAITSATNSSLCPGSYSVTVTDNWGCTATGSTSITQPTLLSAAITLSSSVTCNGACNGTATVAGSGGTIGGGYTYSWNTIPVQTSATATAMCAGTYTVTVRDANNCTNTTTVTISEPSVLTSSISAQTNVSCFGGSTGSVTISGTGGTPSFTYSINGGTTFQTSGTFTGLSAGTYSIIVKDGNNCTVAQAVTITQPTVVSSSITTQTNVSCFGGNTGSATVLATGGTVGYTYSIDGGASFQSSGTFNSLIAGTYTIIVTDGNGCSINQPLTITQPTQVTVTATKVDATCGAANGSLTATGLNGTPGYTYSIGAAFQASGTFTGLAAGTYTVTVKDLNNCTTTTIITIVDLSGLTASISAQTNVSCNGGTNGSVTVVASGSTGPYLYSINGGVLGGSGTFTALSQGIYTVVAQDGNGCTTSVPVTIIQPTVLTGNISAQTNISCFGLSNGSITVVAAGGTATYTYSIDGGAFVASPTFTGLTVGAHTIIIRDANNCAVSVPCTITQPTALTLVTTTTNAICIAANGAATVTASGATPTYTYFWSGSGASTATNSAITAGNYTVTVTDANGCSQTSTTSVGQNPGATAVISSSTNVTCAASNNGTATVSMGAGATPPFTYAWNPGSQTTVTASGLAPASYTVTVTDGNGCISSASVIITEPTILTQTFTTSNISCFGGSDGSITINPAGGTPGYTYLWTPGSYTTQTISGLSAGTYTCVYTDVNGCQKTGSVAITEPAGMSLTSTQVDATCNIANGSATISAGGGTGPYSYLWSDPAAQTTTTASGLPSNTYLVTVTDANACTQTLSVTINNLAGPVATLFATNNVSCFGENDGSATVTVSGGTIPFTFLWNNGQTLPTATNLIAGTYTLVATDANGCIASTSATITEPILLDLAIAGTNPTCFGACNGTLISNTFGGTAPYTYLWNPGGVTTPFTLGLCAGTYTLQVTDVNGCTAFKPATLTAPTAVTASTTSTNISCSGLCNATATANPLTGTGPFTYLWSDISAQSTQTATGLCSGTYTVTVTDAGGCTTTATAVITSPTSMIASITTIGNVTCFAACDGYATATVTGGSAPYNYLWMPTSTAGASVNNLCAANYTVTVTDANGCTASTTATITEPFALVASITSTNVTCYNACDATANAVYTGGTGPFTFQWTPTFQTTPNITNICDGVHDLTVVDGNGCTASASVVISQPTILAVSTVTTNSSCGNADGSACAAVIGGIPPFSYSWNDPSTQTTICASNINSGVYTISITDANGCSIAGLANVNDNAAPVVTIPTSTNVTCAGAANGNAQAAIVGGIVPYTILWSPSGQTTSFISGLSGGIYSVIVTDSIGCVGTSSVTINEPAPLVSGILATSNVSCFLTCDGTATVGAGGGTAPYTYLWNDAATQASQTATGLCAAGYTVTITDVNGCISTSSTTITSAPAINIAVVSTTNVSCNSGNNGAINLNITGGTPGYTYTWTPSVGSGPIVSGLLAGIYTVVVTDQNGCSNTMNFNITEPTAITLSTISNPSTCGNANGFVSVTPSGGTPGYTYLWNDPSNQVSAIATSLPAGAYTVVVTDSQGCTADTSIVLLDRSGPTLDPFAFTEPLCYETALGSATVFPVGGQPLYTYSWSGIGSQITQTATALIAGTYTVTVTDANGCSVTGSVTVTQPSPTDIIVSPTDTICIGENAQLYGAGYGGTPGYTYFWVPATFVGAGPHVVNPTTTSTYNVFLTDANGCVSPTETITLFVNPPVTVSASDVSVCSGSFVTISASASGGNGGPYTYTWSNAVIGASQSVSPSLASSPFDYFVIVDDGCSFLATDTATVTVNPVAIALMLANDTAGCEDFTVTFNAVSDIGTSYSWNFGDGSSNQIGEPVTHTYLNSGSYDVTLTVTTALGCVSSISNVNYIDVFPAPSASFSYSPTSVTQTVPLVSFTDQTIGAGAPFIWSWDFNHPFGIFTDTVQNPSFSYNDPGSYTVQLIVTNTFGCTDTAYNDVIVLPEYTLYVPNAFTPLNNDGINDTFMPQGVGIDPNDFELSIFDRWGSLIYKTTDVNKGWDGRANGGDKIAQIDVYVWKIITKDFNGNEKEYIGHVTIVK